MSWRISRALLARLTEHAEAAHPSEICGLLIGDRAERRIADAITVPNIAPDPAAAFAFDPAMHLAIQRWARGAGLALLGHYHSHPSGIAKPSAADRENIGQEGRLWLILADREATLWIENGRRLEPTGLDATDCSPCKADVEPPIGKG